MGDTTTDTSVDAPQRPALMRVADLSKRFGGIHAVRGVSFDVRRGAATSLIGPNGAGKTTIFNLITGALRADTGSVVFEGREIRGLAPNQVARRGISRTFQDLRLFGSMTVLETVMVSFQHQLGEHPMALVLRPRAVRRQERDLRERAREILDRVGLAGQEKRIAATLSYAEQKLLIISRSIAMRADVWLLDEPASGLDGDALVQFAQLLRGLVDDGQTVLIVEHNLRLVEQVSDWVLFLDQGQLKAEGPPAEIFANKELQEIYMGGGK
ncbi:MAG TPA: ABC transporter ATP-binding protein [Pseudonocardiaceae bacterium]|nr:ABC transporter ATP-binding protein [Pseudonocardiaceae bacterium]